MLTAASVCVPEYRQNTTNCVAGVYQNAFSQRDAFAIHSDGDVQEQNKMLADSVEGARREVPQLMQVRTFVCSIAEE